MSFYKNIGGLVRPTTRDELKYEVQIRLDRKQYNLNDIDTSKITNMSCLFAGWTDLPAIDISKWDTSRVEDMSLMFCDCKCFNSDLSKWNVSNVEMMVGTFYKCINFNCDLSKWDTRKVRNMRYIFDKSGISKKPNWYYYGELYTN